MPIFTVSVYGNPPTGERARLRLGERAIEADDVDQARRIAQRTLGALPSGQFTVVWDDQATAVWDDRVYA